MFSVIILGGGVGERMGALVPKQFLNLLGKPLLEYSLEAFGVVEAVSEVVIVCAAPYRGLLKLEEYPKPVRFADPGKRRQDSVAKGLEFCENEWIAVHDGVRPLVSVPLIENVLKVAFQEGAAVPVVPIKSTLKERDAKGYIKKTHDRDQFFEVQTPQAMRRDWLEKGLQEASRQGLTLTDDVSFIELIGKPVKLVEGEEPNLKVTTPFDLEVARWWLERD